VNNVIQAIREDREELARVLAKHTGIRKIVEDLYPDSAHFIYELLQNAEDAGATKVQFRLTQRGLSFEHDGRPFTEDDVRAITDIGEGTKGTDDEKIGRFGIGFKAVFAYTEEPSIWSPTFSFSISQLVLPTELATATDLGEFTRFYFPFNNPKKPASLAFDEVRTGLNQLDERTLLFLTNIQAVLWQIGGQPEQAVLRDEHPDNHVEILKDQGGGSMDSVHYLRFTQPVKGLERQDVAIAFRLGSLVDDAVYDHNVALTDQFRIVPAQPPRVAVFFAAEKEISGLRFHLHAPFVPELSRASIKDTPANTPLFKQLADLTARSLFVIRDLGLLNTEFLGVLPNPNDPIPARYECIRTAVVTAMREQALTPTYNGLHLPARQLLQSRASLKALLTADDLKYLLQNEIEAPGWAVGAAQRNSDIDRFLASLGIQQWNIDKLVEHFQERLSGRRWFDRQHKRWIDGTDANCLVWLGKKTEQWHQQLYALLYQEIDNPFRLSGLGRLRVVRLSNGEYARGAACFFPTADVQEDTNLPRVAIRTYTSGKSAPEQKNARKFLEEIGVREVGEYEQVEAILKQRYPRLRYTQIDGTIDDAVYKADLRRFVALADAEPKSLELLKRHRIFERNDATWSFPMDVYIDDPYVETGLSVYFEALGNNSKVRALSDRYLDAGISRERLARFAASVGVKVKLEIEEVSCAANPEWSYLSSAPGKSFTCYGTDIDFEIPGLKDALASPTTDLVRLVWRVVQSQTVKEKYLRACYKKNSANAPHYADSQLIHTLRDSKWIPQTDGQFVAPRDADVEDLPEGFPFDAKAEWVSLVRFGENIEKQAARTSKKQELAKDLGFKDNRTLEDARWFAKLSSEERKQFKLEYESRRIGELPTSEPRNPDRRKSKVAEEAGFAPEKRSEERTRSVSIGREAVKQETDPYLRQQYTNHDGEMICQICHSVLPFRLADGNYFFFAVEFLSDLKKIYHQNYLALCPLHGAMFRWANASKPELEKLFLDLTDCRMPVSLAGQSKVIYFTQTHIDDLHVAIESDKSAPKS
jgi:hypothetical protein